MSDHQHNMDFLKLIIAAGIMWILFVNLTRVIWKATETVDIKDKQTIACLEGGGTVAINGFGEFFRCESK